MTVVRSVVFTGNVFVFNWGWKLFCLLVWLFCRNTGFASLLYGQISVIPARALLSGSEKERVKLQRQWKLRHETVLTPSKKPSPRGTGQPTPQSFIRVNSAPRSNPYPFIFDSLGAYGGPQLSRQNQKPHDKTKIPHGKTENLTAKPKTSRQNQNPHGKTKIHTAKLKTSRQNQHEILHSKNQIPRGKTKAILLLLWSIWFCREVFCFCREVFGFAVRYFVFAVRFLVLPRCFCFCREVFGFAVTVVCHHRSPFFLPLKNNGAFSQYVLTGSLLVMLHANWY